jgi:hypothetical protein
MSRFTDAAFAFTGKTRRGRPIMRLTTPLAYEVDYLGSGWVVAAPVGFETDGPSVPWWAVRLLPVGMMVRASIVHDKLRSEPRRSKLLGDLIFFEAMGVDGVPLFWRLIAFVGVLLNFSRDPSHPLRSAD